MILYLLKSIKNIKAVVSLQHIKNHDFTSVIGGGGGGYCHIYLLLWRVWLSCTLVWDRVKKSEILGLDYDIIFQETDLSLD